MNEDITTRFRRSYSLVMSYYDTEIGVHNFFTRTRFSCSIECLDFLAKLDDWRSYKEILTLYPSLALEDVTAQINELVQWNAVIVEGTAAADADNHLRKSWQWGVAGGYFHFITRDAEFPRDYTIKNLLFMRKEWDQTEPDYYETNANSKRVVPLPNADVTSGLLSIMWKRRSHREYLPASISLYALSDCLYAGNGFAYPKQPASAIKKPTKMTPSAGACNPYELYIYANRVEDLERGFYHYSAIEHNLGLIKTGEADTSKISPGQNWIANASAIIFLVANFRRVMWSFHKPIGYRLTLIEAGFIGQNISLMAANHGLSAVPLGSLAHSKIESYIDISSVESSVILGMCIGLPLAS